MKQKTSNAANRGSPANVSTLCIDIGGSGLKASVLDRTGKMVVDRVRVKTPHPCTPKILLQALADLVSPLPPFDRISVGFPGVIRDGRTLTAPHFSERPWCNFPLAAALSKRFGKPVRLLNDAEVQGFGIVKGRGLEVVLTLGTGAGTAVFRDGVLMPHLELAQHQSTTIRPIMNTSAAMPCGARERRNGVTTSTRRSKFSTRSFITINCISVAATATKSTGYPATLKSNQTTQGSPAEFGFGMPMLHDLFFKMTASGRSVCAPKPDKKIAAVDAVANR